MRGFIYQRRTRPGRGKVRALKSNVSSKVVWAINKIGQTGVINTLVTDKAKNSKLFFKKRQVGSGGP